MSNIQKQPPDVLWEKVCLKISQNVQENTRVRVSFLIKLQAKAYNFIKKETRPATFIKKETLAQVFSGEFCKFF